MRIRGGDNQPWWCTTKGVCAAELGAGGSVINAPPWTSPLGLKLAAGFMKVNDTPAASGSLSDILLSGDRPAG
jgi:hypothetical protein